MSLIPRFFLARQEFPRPRVEDVAAAARAELEALFPAGALRAGARIGVTVGSRGIAGIDRIARAAVDFLKSRGARPFILPAMGSHGGAEAAAQRNLIAHYGVTEETMGCPVEDAMETRSLGRTAEGVETFIAETAWRADGVLLMNRVKPHTDFKGPIESGLTKICAIGLGKLQGAEEYHSHIFDIGLGAAIRSAAARVLETGRIIGGLAILENAYHETARIAGVGVKDFFAREAALLVEARGLMGRLPFPQIDVLVCDRMGKNISGAGLDTNIIGRSVYGFVQGQPWQEGMPAVDRIVVLDLSDESDGNAVGMGLADFTTERFIAKINRRVTQLNSCTACSPWCTKTPNVLANDREAIETAVRTCVRRPEGPRIAHVRDTLALETVSLSEAYLAQARAQESLEVLSEPAPLVFDGEGNVVSPF
jgi:hypothetical protein